jgi:hypothetical protein
MLDGQGRNRNGHVASFDVGGSEATSRVCPCQHAIRQFHHRYTAKARLIDTKSSCTQQVAVDGYAGADGTAAFKKW